MNILKAAVPTANGLLTMHFGHCEAFEILDADMEAKKIVAKTTVKAPPHEPGLLPKWLGERGVKLIIAGGMGSRAQGLFAERGIEVVTGAPCEAPEALVLSYMNGTLESGANVCDH